MSIFTHARCVGQQHSANRPGPAVLSWVPVLTTVRASLSVRCSYYYNPATGVTQWEKPPGM